MRKCSKFSVYGLFSLVLLSNAPSLRADSNLIFPRASFDPNLITGIAIANPGAQDAEVTITAYGTDGLPLSGDGIQNPVKIAIAANQQVAKVSSGLFGAVDPAAVAWMRATSTTDGLTGFFLLIDTSITLMDGADLPVVSQKLMFNLVRIDAGYTSELNLVNPGSATAEVQIQLAGISPAPVIKQLSIPANGIVRLDAASFFQASSIAPGAYVAIDSNVELAGFELVRSATGDGVGLNARRVSEKLTTLYFLQLSVLGPDKTQLGIVNYASEPVVLTITATKPDGTLYDSSNLQNNPVTRSLAGGGSLREDLQTMFGFTGSQPLDGWLTVKSTSQAINGYLTFSNPTTGSEAAVTSAAQGRLKSLLSHIATVSPYYTGIAVLNPGTLPANLRIVALKQTGEILGSYDTTLQPGQRISKVLGNADFIAGAAGQVGGLVYVKSDSPVYVSSIIGTDRTVSNIPAQEAPESYSPDANLPTLKISPPIAIVPPGNSQKFQVSGGVTTVWKVNGVTGGEGSVGTITSAGVFTAPRTVPARQVVTITAEAENQSVGASADVLTKSLFNSSTRVIQSVAYMSSLRRVYSAELAALSAPQSAQLASGVEKAAINSEIYEVSLLVPQILLTTYSNENIVKILAFTASDGKEYLLLLGQTTGRVIRLEPTSKSAKDVVTGLNQPTSMVLDPVSGDLLVVEQDKITTIPKATLQAGLTSSAPSAQEAAANTEALTRSFGAVTINGAAGIAVDRCTGKIYLSIADSGSLVEYNPTDNSIRTALTGLLNPGQLLGIYRAGVTCPDSFHLLISERGANRVDLYVPGTGALTVWADSTGIEDLAFMPIGNPYTQREGVLLADYSLAKGGEIYVVPMAQLYDNKATNPPDTALLDVKTDVSISQTSTPSQGAPGTTITYTGTVVNNGSVTATAVIVLDTLPSATTFVSASSSIGNCNATGATVLCSIGTLPAGAQATITIRASIKAQTPPGTISNSMDASAAEVDPDPTNNHSTQTTTVLQPTASSLSITGPAGPLNPGDFFSITVSAVDPTGSIVPGYTGKIHFTSNDVQASLPADYTFSAADGGSHTFSGLTLSSAGNQTITVVQLGTNPLRGEFSVQVQAATATSAQITGMPATIAAGSTQSLNITLTDSFGNLAASFAGLAHFTSTDPQAGLPADHLINPSDAGRHTFYGIVLKTSGNQSITLTLTPSAAAPRTGERSRGSGRVNAAQITTVFNVLVNPGATVVFSLTASGTVFVGDAFNLTVAARDAFGNTTPAYSGTAHFTSSDPSASLPANYTFVAGDNGQHTVSATLRTPGNQNVVATDVATPTITGSAGINAITRPVSHFNLVPGTTTPTAGTQFNLTVTPVDAADGILNTYNGTVRVTSTDPQAATLVNSYTFTTGAGGDNGSHTFGVTLRSSGSQTVTVTEIGGTGLTGNTIVNVGPAAPAGFNVQAPSPVTAGTPFNLTASVRDNFGNPVPSFTGSVRITSSDPQAATLVNSYTYTTADNGSHLFNATLLTAGNQTITATNIEQPTITGSTPVTVNSAGASRLLVTPTTPTPNAGAPFTTRVTPNDPYGNTVPNYAGTVHLTSSDTGAVLPGNYTFNPPTDFAGHDFTIILNTPGNQSIVATDTVNTGITGSANVTVANATASSFGVVPGTTTPTAGVPFNLTVTARGPTGGVVNNFAGNVTVVSTDPQALVLVNSYTFIPGGAGDNGVHAFNVTLFTAGNTTITVNEIGGGGATGNTLVAVLPGPASSLSLQVPSTAQAGVPFSFTVQALDAFNNTATNFGGLVTFFVNPVVQAGETFPTNYLFVPATDHGTHTFVGGATFTQQGPRQIQASEPALPIANGTVNVGPGAVNLFLVQIPSSGEAGTPFNIQVTARDALGNTVTNYTGTVTVTTSDLAANPLVSSYTFTPSDNGIHIFNAFLQTKGNQTVTATDVSSGATGTSGIIILFAGPLHHFIVSGIPNPTTIGTHDLGVTAVDLYNNTITNYVGTVTFQPPPSTASVPADYTFTSCVSTCDNGAHLFFGGVNIFSPGPLTITVRDTANPSITGSLSTVAN